MEPNDSGAIRLLGIDADDTLWQNEQLYSDARRRFVDILQASSAANGHGLPHDLEAVIHETDIANLPYYGYGVTSFVMSLMETAVRVTDARVSARELQEVLAIGKEMLQADILLLDGVEVALEQLAARWPLALITKGDLLQQEGKVARSGIDYYFDHIEVVSDKTADTYAALLRRLDVPPASFMMVGNSLRSDILPVLKLGGHAVFVPHELTWHHEHTDPPSAAHGRFHQIDSLAELPDLLSNLGR